MSAFARRGAALLLGGFLVLLGSGGSAAARDSSHSRYLRVLMFDYRFEPSRLALRRGTPYRFHFVNRGKEWHEFTAPEFLKKVALGNAKALEANGDLAVPPGGEQDLYLVPLTAGRYGFHCADHDWAGWRETSRSGDEMGHASCALTKSRPILMPRCG